MWKKWKWAVEVQKSDLNASFAREVFSWKPTCDKEQGQVRGKVIPSKDQLNLLQELLRTTPFQHIIFAPNNFRDKRRFQAAGYNTSVIAWQYTALTAAAKTKEVEEKALSACTLFMRQEEAYQAVEVVDRFHVWPSPLKL